jgi:hypothetical protein
MSEGRMADVVDQRQRLRQIFIEAERRSGSARDLCDFNGVGQPAAKVVGGATGEYLRLSCETAKGASLHDSFAVTLKRRSRGA